MDITVGGRHRLLGAGEISVALGYESHVYRTPEASRSSVLLIPPYMCEEFIAATNGKRLESPFITEPEVTAEIRRYYAALKEEGVGKIRQIGYIYTMLGIILDNVRLVDEKEPVDTDLGSRMLFYINENYKNGITPASIASHFGYNQSYISRYFKSCFGINLVKYLTVTRLKSALFLLGEGKQDITYCALESGFSSMRTFYRAFRSEFGTSPKEYISSLGK
jgi:AraC-like DNA-binding protein